MDEVRRRGLVELEAACDESIRYGGSGWVKTSRICGTKDERSAKNMCALVDLGFAEGEKQGVTPQGQWMFRITQLGRQVLAG